MANSYLFNFIANGNQDFFFPEDATMIIPSGTFGTATVSVLLYDYDLAAYQTIEAWTSASTIPYNSLFLAPSGSKGRITVSGAGGTNVNITIKRGVSD